MYCKTTSVCKRHNFVKGEGGGVGVPQNPFFYFLYVQQQKQGFQPVFLEKVMPVQCKKHFWRIIQGQNPNNFTAEKVLISLTFCCCHSWFHRPSVLFRISIGTQVTCTYISLDFLSQPKFVPLPRDRVAMCTRPASKHQNKFCFVSKQACIYCIRSEG